MLNMTIFYPNGRIEDRENSNPPKPNQFTYPYKTTVYVRDGNTLSPNTWYMMKFSASAFTGGGVSTSNDKNKARLIPAKMEWQRVDEDQVDPRYRTWVLLNP